MVLDVAVYNITSGSLDADCVYPAVSARERELSWLHEMVRKSHISVIL